MNSFEIGIILILVIATLIMLKVDVITITIIIFGFFIYKKIKKEKFYKYPSERIRIVETPYSNINYGLDKYKVPHSVDYITLKNTGTSEKIDLDAKAEHNIFDSQDIAKTYLNNTKAKDLDSKSVDGQKHVSLGEIKRHAPINRDFMFAQYKNIFTPGIDRAAKSVWQYESSNSINYI